MSYYENKKRAIHIIDRMLKEGEPDIKIIYKIETLFGFGEKLVFQRKERLRELITIEKMEREHGTT